MKKFFCLFKLNPVAFLLQIKRLYRKTKMKIRKMKTPRWLKGWTNEENNEYPGKSDREMNSDSSDHDSDDSSILSNEPM